MKRALIFVALLVLALVGVAWADDLGNGISVTNVNYENESIIALPAVAEARSVEGAAPGGLRPEKELANGITYFEMRAPSVHETTSPEIPHNGITVFQ